MTTFYRVVRHFADHPRNDHTVRRGLTLEEAKEHCRDPETSSRTARSPRHRDLTERMGPWFDGYEGE
jgi:hypothetical protein